MELPSLKKYNLGCGIDIRDGYVNVDLSAHSPGILAQDLNENGWGKSFSPAGEILALDLIEHLNDPIAFMNECWDALETGGKLIIKACGWQNPNFWVDITHKRAYDIKSFDYFDPETDLGRRYGFYTDRKWRIVSKEYDRRKNVLITLSPIK